MKTRMTSGLVVAVIVAFGVAVGAQRSTPPGRSGGGQLPAGQRPGGPGRTGGDKPTTPPKDKPTKPGKDGKPDKKPCKPTPTKPC